ncbi:MAG: RluA family pseudouridine synthase [Bacteroidetes bacterium]|jgi:23S rRNA pseudouridine955/2504/2580 synthase/23S rRNA pseudouridine1911/1915/1917 synthase|nr:RluA family pseudouridine synthase [Bacteroidota bacterium]MCA6445306.1 RluA family pseudouridine synthase [Bacteroidota bacterium]
MEFKDLILFEDETLLVVNKPNGLMVEPDRNNHPNLLDFARKYVHSKYNAPYVQHLHRLDRPTSGVVLFTKKRECLNILSNQFAERKVEKIYVAISNQFPSIKEGKLIHWHRKEKKKAKLYTEPVLHAEEAALEYKTENIYNKCFWTIILKTGKYHQIRAQLQFINCSIIGDTEYGSDTLFEDNFIALHAKSLEFTHPVSHESITITAPTSDRFNKIPA